MNRLDHLRQAHSAALRDAFLERSWATEGEQALFNLFADADPSAGKQHLGWILRLYLSGRLRAEDLYKVPEHGADSTARRSASSPLRAAGAPYTRALASTPRNASGTACAAIPATNSRSWMARTLSRTFRPCSANPSSVTLPFVT